MRLFLPLILCVMVCAARPTRAVDAGSIDNRLADIERELRSLPRLTRSIQSHQRIGFHGHAADPAWVMIDFDRTVEPEKIAVFPARLPTSAEAEPTGFPPAFEIEIAATSDFRDAVRIAHWAEPSPGASERVPMLIFPGNGAAGRFLRITVTAFRDDPGQPGHRSYRLGEIVVLADGRNAALGRTVTSTASTESSRRWEARNLTDGYFWCLPLRGTEDSPANGYQSASERHPLVNHPIWVEIDLGHRCDIDELHLVPAHPPDFADLPGYGFPPHFRVIVDPDTPDERVILDETSPPYPGQALPNPGAAQVMLSTPSLHARRVRLVAESLWRRGPGSGAPSHEYMIALAELQLWHRGVNLAHHRPVAAATVTDEPRWSPAALTDGYSSRHRLLTWADWLDAIERVHQLHDEADALLVERAAWSDQRQRRMLFAALAAVIATALAAAIAVGIIWIRSLRSQAALRARIARDLHDEIGASLSHLAIQSDLSRRHLLHGSLQPDRLEAIALAARQTLDHMRDVIWLLAPTIENCDALSHRIQAIAERLLDGIDHDVEVIGTPPARRPSIAIARDTVAFLKEALTNARQHARATHVRVQLTWGPRLTLTIDDNGRGFELEAARRSGGCGLGSLVQRAAALHGDCRITSQPGHGTRVELSVPITFR